MRNANLSGVNVERGITPGVVTLRQRGRFLCPQAANSSADFTRADAKQWEGVKDKLKLLER